MLTKMLDESKIRIKVESKNPFFKVIIVINKRTSVSSFAQELINRLEKYCNLSVKVLDLRINGFKLCYENSIESSYEEDEMINVNCILQDDVKININFLSNTNESIEKLVPLNARVLDEIKEIYPYFQLNENAQILNNYIELESKIKENDTIKDIIKYDNSCVKNDKYIIFIQWLKYKNIKENKIEESNKLFLKRFTGPAYTINMYKYTKMETLKEMFFIYQNIKKEDIKFIYTGTRSDMNGTIESNRIRKGVILHIAPNNE